MEERITKYIKINNLHIKEIVRQPFLGSDIRFERKDDGWSIQLYPRVWDTNIGSIYILISLSSIKNKDLENTDEIINEIEEYYDRDDLFTNELYGIYQAINLGRRLNELLKEEYISLDEARLFSSYLSNHFVTVTVATQFLASIAALRNNKGQISILQEELIKNKNYEMLKVIDIIEESLNNTVILDNIVTIFNLLINEKSDITQILKDISVARDKAFGNRKLENLDYDVALSFAGEDRKIASEIAKQLKEKNIKVFYDEYEKADLWGKDLYSHLTDVYSKRARFCLMIISKHYKQKQWTNLERKAAQSKAFTENIEYILPLKLDDTEIQGLLPTTGYIDFNHTEIKEIVKLLVEKVNYVC